MNYIKLAIDELEKRSGISAGMAREQYKQLQAIATAAREVMRKHDAKAVECNFTICGCDYCDSMRPQLAALEQETR